MKKTMIFKDLIEAEATASELAFSMEGWSVSVQPSPEDSSAWGIRADQLVIDINEEEIPGTLGRSIYIWLREDGTISFPDDDK